MGLTDWFIRRRMAKLSGGAVAAPPGAVTEINGLGDVGALMSQWQQFQGASGGIGAGIGMHDLPGADMRDEIMAALQKHGVPTNGRGAIGVAAAIDEDPNDLMGLQGDILGVLAKHGIDTSQLGIEAAPGAPPPAEPTAAADLPPIRDPLA
ncbi:MAG: hypothetical protein U0R24_10860 [Solirubrobacterales bacterium]